jgi:hypothetical protein
MKKTSTKKESEAEINELIEIASNHTVKAIELEKLENKIDIFCKKSLEEIGFKTQMSLLKVYKKQKNLIKFSMFRIFFYSPRFQPWDKIK